MKTRRCETCGKLMEGETPKLMTKQPGDQIIVRPLCSQACAEPIVQSHLQSKTCIWCGAVTNPNSWRLGGFGEPYCNDKCYSEAGRAMFIFEMKEGNI